MKNNRLVTLNGSELTAAGLLGRGATSRTTCVTRVMLERSRGSGGVV